jgi:RNA polymerase sigma-70 factor (ECF subfamily)
VTAVYDIVPLMRASAIVEGVRPPRVVVAEEPLDSCLVAAPTVRAAKDAAVFRSFYDAQVAFVWRNLRRLGVQDRDVEDKCQEVFVVAHRRWEEFVDLGHGPRAWLFQIVLRVAADARRHRRRHPIDPDGGVAEARQSVDASQAASIARKQSLALLDRGLAMLDLGRRAVLVLHEIEQMTAPEIAKALDLPLNTVYSRLRVARRELDEALQQLNAAADDSPARAR